MRKFDGRVAVITGGAAGIGLGLARRFGAEGMKLVIADMDEAGLKSATNELKAAGYDVLAQKTDVSKADQVEALADATVARFGAAHILCNNAGVGGFLRFSKTPQATWDWILGVNLWGPIHGCRIFLPILAKQDEAHIVNTASMAGFYYSAYHHPYNVAKAGVVALSEGLTREFATEHPNIGISCLSPAHVATSIANDERNAPAGVARRNELDPELEEYRQRTNRALDLGKSTAFVADLVLQAIKDRQLHIFTHPEWLGVIKMRADDIIAGKMSDMNASDFIPKGA